MDGVASKDAVRLAMVRVGETTGLGSISPALGLA